MLECFTTKQALCLKDAFIIASSAFVQCFLPTSFANCCWWRPETVSFQSQFYGLVVKWNCILTFSVTFSKTCASKGILSDEIPFFKWKVWLITLLWLSARIWKKQNRQRQDHNLTFVLNYEWVIFSNICQISRISLCSFAIIRHLSVCQNIEEVRCCNTWLGLRGFVIT